MPFVRRAEAVPVRRGQPSSGSIPVNSAKPNPAHIRPSILHSSPTMSTGSADLDQLLGHGGLPLGSVLLIEESGATDFSSVLLRLFAVSGIVHSRRGHASKTVVLADVIWARELPGLDKKHTQSSSQPVVSSSDMRIAWRYAQYSKPDQTSAPPNPDYCIPFDLTTRLTPMASPDEMVYLSPRPNPQCLAEFAGRLSQLASQAQREGSVIRLVVPALLSPSAYGPQYGPQDVMPFMHCIQTLCRTYSSMSVVVSLSLELYPRESALVRWIELLADGVIHLEPAPGLEDSVDRSKKLQGLLHVYRLPGLSQAGAMVRRTGEHGFCVTRRRFEVSDLGIPIGEEAEEPKDELEF